MSTPDDQDEPREVLSSLPRSRRQRPSARREAARAKATAKPAAAKPRATKAKATAKATARPSPAPAATTRARRPAAPKRSAVPPAGYATPHEGSGRGSADPAAALVGLARGLRGLLPF